MSDPNSKIDRFKPAAPQIPGVPAPAPEKPEKKESAAPAEPPIWASRKVQIGAGLVVAFLVLAVVAAWLIRPAPPPTAIGLEPRMQNTQGSQPTQETAPAPVLPQAPGPVASVQETAKPWSLVKFQLRKSSGEILPARLLRLPTGSGAGAYWGFLGVGPYGRCELELETDLAKLAKDYNYRARHPMVVDPCNQTVYDPLAYGNDHGTWIRGQVATGPGLRPPLAVEISVENGNVVASRSE
jgi:hypothetical protein